MIPRCFGCQEILCWCLQRQESVNSLPREGIRGDKQCLLTEVAQFVWCIFSASHLRLLEVTGEHTVSGLLCIVYMGMHSMGMEFWPYIAMAIVCYCNFMHAQFVVG